MTTSLNIQKIYVAFFNRPADAAGLKFWVDRIDSGAGSLAEITSAFAQSLEYKTLYAGSSPEAVITAVYKNLFGRAPEADGLKYWADALTNGTASPGLLAYQVLNGAQGTDRATIDNKASASTIFTQSLPSDPKAYDGEVLGAARAWLSKIDAKPIDTAAVEQSVVGIIGEVANDNGTGGDTGFVDDGLPPPISHTFDLGWNGRFVADFVNHVKITGFDPREDGIRISPRDGYEFETPDIVHFTALGPISGADALKMAIFLMQGNRGDGTPLMAGEVGVFSFINGGVERTFLFVDDGNAAIAGWGNAVGAAVYNSDSDLVVDITGVVGLAVNGNAVENLWLAA